MLDFLRSIADAASALITFLASAIRGIFSILSLIPRALYFITQALGSLPPWIAGIAAMSIAVIVTLAVLRLVK